MATIGGSANFTLLDLVKRLQPDGKGIDVIAETLETTNEINGHVPWKECNDGTGHQTTMRTGLPAVSTTMLSGYTVPTKSTTAQARETCGHFESISQIPTRIANLSGNPAASRWSEAVAHIQAMGQKMATTLFYGNGASAPAEFTGFSPRYSLSTAGNALNLIRAGGAGSDNASIWLISWGEDVHGIYPFGTVAGLQRLDRGVQDDVNASTGGIRQVYREVFSWDAGLVVRDWTKAVRICNIDVSNLVAKSTAADLFDKMHDAINCLPSEAVASARFYMNRTVLNCLQKQKREDVSVGGQLNYEVVDGKFTRNFDTVPVHRCDALLEAETLVT